MHYNTISTQSSITYIEKKSEFIAYIAPVKTNDEAVEFINSVKSINRKATHNVYAYILRQDNITRYSDDGEPQGTAGIPVLDVLKKEGLTDICCVVTRYFGGILLGGGGLVRAYSHSCSLAVASATRMKMCECIEIKATTDYNMYGKITFLIPEFEVKVIDTQFADDVCITMLAKIEKKDALIDKLIDITNGTVIIVKGDVSFQDFS